MSFESIVERILTHASAHGLAISRLAAEQLTAGVLDELELPSREMIASGAAAMDPSMTRQECAEEAWAAMISACGSRGRWALWFVREEAADIFTSSNAPT